MYGDCTIVETKECGLSVIENCSFDSAFAYTSGGALNMGVPSNASFSLLYLIFTNCTVDGANNGGGIYLAVGDNFGKLYFGKLYFNV